MHCLAAAVLVEGKKHLLIQTKFKLTLYPFSNCNPCRTGQRCHQCTHLISYHLGFIDGNREEGIPFQESFIDMFKDMKANLEANSMYYAEQEIIDLFQFTTNVLTTDCTLCKNYPVIIDVSDHTNEVATKLTDGTWQTDWPSLNFSSAALSEVSVTIQLFEKIPLSKEFAVPRKALNVSFINHE